MTDTANIYESMTLEELERLLPLSVQVEETVDCPCPRCGRDRSECTETRTYVQEVYRDGEERHRIYDISYRRDRNRNALLFRTDRYTSFREALIEAHETLAGMGSRPDAKEGAINAE